MCDQTINNYPYALKFVHNCYKTEKVCDKAFNTYHSTTQSVTDCYKTQ